MMKLVSTCVFVVIFYSCYVIAAPMENRSLLTDEQEADTGNRRPATISIQELEPESQLESSTTGGHKRIRRSFGTKTIFVAQLKKFCKKFTSGTRTRRFCLMATVKHCTALD